MKTTEQYNALQCSSAAACETNDCVVKAIAQVLRMSYEEAHDLCAEYGRKNGDGMYQGDWVKILRDRGVELTHVVPESFIDRYPGVHSSLQNVTTHHPDRFNKVWADGHRYLFICRRHVAYIENGVNHDWTRGTARRVITIYRVEN